MTLNQIFFDTYCTMKMSNHCNPKLHMFIHYLPADNLPSFAYCVSNSAITAGLFPSSVITFSVAMFKRDP